MDRNWIGQWIVDPAFKGLQPLQVFHKETEPSPLEAAAHLDSLKNRHTIYRQTFMLTKSQAAEGVSLFITADDYYKIYVNGKLALQGPAQSYYFHYYYNEYPITEFLHAGENTIAVHVYYQGLICRAFNSGDYRQGLIAELVTHDGGQVIAATDSSWRTAEAKWYSSGGIVGYDTQFLENIDSGMEERGWKQPGFDDSHWQSALVNYDDDHQLFKQPTPPVAIYSVSPAEVTMVDEGRYLIDFGQEITGQFTMKASGPARQQVVTRCGEELQADGYVRYEMRCNCRYEEIWTLSGEEEDELDFYDYKAFRYVELLAQPGVILELPSFRAIVRHYPIQEEASHFHTSNELLNQIWLICKNGVKYGAQEHYVDCPTREKGQYLGDNTIITHAHAYLSGDLRLFKKSLAEFAQLTPYVCTGMMAVAPGHLMQEIADFSFQWPMQLLQYYKQSGDIVFVREMLPVAEGIMAYFARYRRPDGLVENVLDKWNLVDWPAGMQDEYDFPLTRPVTPGCHNVINAFCYGAMGAIADLYELMGMVDEARRERRDMAAFKIAFGAAFLDRERGLFVDAVDSKHASLHANALPLLFGLAPDQARDSIVGLIREKRLQCGVYMAYFVLKALASAGEYALVYELITSDDAHSWSTMLKEGATTCFEAWSKELKWNTSLCHPWASGPVPILIEEVIGLRPRKPGWEEVQFDPHLPEELEDISLHFQTPRGAIRFEYKQGVVSLEVPEGVVLHRS